MKQEEQYFIVDAAVLPEVFLRVTEAKALLETGEVKTVNDAVRQVGLSRSAFYKYRDTIRPFHDMLKGRIVNLQLLLKNETGVLSRLLNVLAQCGANILTINQSIPAGGSAIVNIGIETSGLSMTANEMLSRIRGEQGVVRCEILAS